MNLDEILLQMVPLFRSGSILQKLASLTTCLHPAHSGPFAKQSVCNKPITGIESLSECAENFAQKMTGWDTLGLEGGRWPGSVQPNRPRGDSWIEVCLNAYSTSGNREARCRRCRGCRCGHPALALGQATVNLSRQALLGSRPISDRSTYVVAAHASRHVAGFPLLFADKLALCADTSCCIAPNTGASQIISHGRSEILNQSSVV